MNQQPQEHRLATAEQIALLAMPALMASFPVVVGQYTWEKLSVCCSLCGVEIDASDLHGRIDLSESGMALVESIGLCRKCNVHSMAMFGLNSEGQLLALNNGEWVLQETTTKFWNDFSKTLDL